MRPMAIIKGLSPVRTPPTAMSDEISAGEPIHRDQPFTIEVAERVRRLPPYLFAEINRLMYEKRRAGDDVIDLGMGNPQRSAAGYGDREAGRGRSRSRGITATRPPRAF